MSAPRPAVALIGQKFWTSRLSSLVAAYASDLLDVQLFDSVAAAPRGLRADLMVRVGYRPGAPTWRGRAFDAAWGAMTTLASVRRGYYWIGTDVWNAQADEASAGHTGWFRREASAAAHWAGASWLSDELQELGVPAQTVLFPAELPQAIVTRLPEQFRVLTYIPDSRPEFYGAPQLVAAARALPDVQFDVIGGRGAWLRNTAPNVNFLGWLRDPTTAYLSSSVVMRLVEHDALGGSVREGLALGRHILYTYPVPHVRQVRWNDTESVIHHLRHLAKLHADGSLQPNLTGLEFARTAFDTRLLTRAFATQLREATA